MKCSSNTAQEHQVEVNTSRNDITNGFNITYRGRNAKTTQAVTAELASKYIDEQTTNTINSTTSAKQFIDQQVNQTKEELDLVDKARLDFMQKNVGNLPSEAVSLVGQLSGLRETQKAYISEVGRFQDRRSALSGQLALVKEEFRERQLRCSRKYYRPQNNPCMGPTSVPKADLESQLTRMLTDLRPSIQTCSPSKPK